MLRASCPLLGVCEHPAQLEIQRQRFTSSIPHSAAQVKHSASQRQKAQRGANGSSPGMWHGKRWTRAAPDGREWAEIACNSSRAGRGSKSRTLRGFLSAAEAGQSPAPPPSLAGRVLPLPMVQDVGSGALLMASPEMLDEIDGLRR